MILASTLVTTGKRRSRNSTAARSAERRASALFIKAEWKGALTGSITARAPLMCITASSTASLCPAMTTWSSLFQLAIWPVPLLTWFGWFAGAGVGGGDQVRDIRSGEQVDACMYRPLL